MQTRRQLLQQSILLPFVPPLITGQATTASARNLEILAESDCLSQESARGFALIPPRCAEVVVVCGAGLVASSWAPELRRRAAAGTWILWEAAPHASDPSQFRAFRETMQNVFGIKIGSPFEPGLYIEHVWPTRDLTRSFLAAIPVECSRSEIVARHGEIPVAMKRRIGGGGIVFLGSMLGPNLAAEEREAHRIAVALTQAMAEAFS